MLQIKNHFEQRYREIYSASIQDNTRSAPSSSIRSNRYSRLPKRREMNVFESVQHYKNMIFDIFSGEPNAPN